MRTSIFTKLSRSLATLVVASILLGAAPSTAQASGRCPAPGTGLPGALNMIRDAAMGAGTATDPMIHDAAQGNAGMFIAVNNTAC